MANTPTPFPELNYVLDDLIGRVQVVLGANFVGAYLQGSFAIGDFDRHSDVDFVIVTADALSQANVSGLQAMHKRLFALEIAWAQHLEGSYFPANVLRRPPRGDRQLWYLDHGSSHLIPSDHCNTLLVRWVVREHGVALAGPAPATLVEPIPVTALRTEILVTMRNWGSDILAHPEPYNNRFYQTYIVLAFCRMLHDLHTGVPGSKRAGAAWAKSNLDPSWIGLIDRTWAGRPNPALSVRQPADSADFRATLQFVRHIMDQGTMFAQSHPNDLAM